MGKTLALAAGALLLLTGSASALTVHNKSDKEITIGLDSGNKEEVQKVPAGKSFDAKGFCSQNEGCGVTGPWGYSVLAKPGETVIYDNGEAWAQKS